MTEALLGKPAVAPGNWQLTRLENDQVGFYRSSLAGRCGRGNSATADVQSLREQLSDD